MAHIDGNRLRIAAGISPDQIDLLAQKRQRRCCALTQMERRSENGICSCDGHISISG